MYGNYGYYGSSYSREVQNLMGTYGIVSLILAVIGFATMWRIFTKAGQKGWKSLIPIYNAYIQFEIGWEGSKFWMLFLGSLGLSILSGLLGLLGEVGVIIGGIIALAWSIYALVIAVKFSIRMAHRFGKSTAFGVVGLLLFSLIGYLILAWGSADYNAARDYGDGILRSESEIAKDRERSDEFWKKMQQ